MEHNPALFAEIVGVNKQRRLIENMLPGAVVRYQIGLRAFQNLVQIKLLGSFLVEVNRLVPGEPEAFIEATHILDLWGFSDLETECLAAELDYRWLVR